MAYSELFLLLHESGEETRFINRSSVCMPGKVEMEYLKKLQVHINCFQTENYRGYYDSNNVKSHLSQFEVLDEYYPGLPMILRSLLEEWEDWREVANSRGDYLIFDGDTISNHVFCEVAQRQFEDTIGNTYLILNHDALAIQKENIALFVGQKEISIKALSLNKTFDWFSKNRRPERIYHPSSKHGENGKGNWPNAAKLFCSHEEAETMMHKAIKIGDELYWQDTQERYITYRKEGNIPECKYHAYHIEGNEIDDAIKNRIRIFLAYIR